jgi:hypothetical protein
MLLDEVSFELGQAFRQSADLLVVEAIERSHSLLEL